MTAVALAALPPSTSTASRIDAQWSPLVANTLIAHLHPDPINGVHNITHAMMREMSATLDLLCGSGASAAMAPTQYLIMQSSHPGYFSIGGDLAFFLEHIRAGNEVALRDYALHAWNLIFTLASTLRATSTSIAVVQGRALGGGFELALAADYLIAEEDATFGLPEIMFGLFPMSGAMPLLTDRVGARMAERIITGKRIYSAEELHQLGIVDEVCPSGTGMDRATAFVRGRQPRDAAMLAMQRARAAFSSISYNAGVEGVETWLQLARGLTANASRTLEMLVMMQAREGEAYLEGLSRPAHPETADAAKHA